MKRYDGKADALAALDIDEFFRAITVKDPEVAEGGGRDERRKEEEARELIEKKGEGPI